MQLSYKRDNNKRRGKIIKSCFFLVIIFLFRLMVFRLFFYFVSRFDLNLKIYVTMTILRSEIQIQMNNNLSGNQVMSTLKAENFFSFGPFVDYFNRQQKMYLNNCIFQLVLIGICEIRSKFAAVHINQIPGKPNLFFTFQNSGS